MSLLALVQLVVCGGGEEVMVAPAKANSSAARCFKFNASVSPAKRF